ncbi:MAG: transporter substrate-binding domain-containing protein [Tissierellia bacterium]|nr:transporter substrate-binding domain-containing protein [Tissierellia bacterium]
MRKVFLLLIILISISSILAPCYAAGEIDWTEDEVDFINKHPVITLGVDPGFVPFEFIDIDGGYKGIAADYILLISEKIGIKFEVVKGLTWPEAYNMTLLGEIDVLPAISKTEERERLFIFTEPYYYSKRVIVTKDTEMDITGIEDLEGLFVAVQRDSSHHSYLLSNPKINLSLYESTEEALKAVENGSERVLLANIATTNYLIRTTGLTNLKITAFESEEQQALYFAVRKDLPVLESILNKTLHTITEEEKIIINNKWVSLEQDKDYSSIIRIISIIGVLGAVVMAVSFYWIILLKKEIQKRELIQIDLEKAKSEADEANKYKSNFMARMSHEIRTPLNAITGMTYLLKETQLTSIQNMYADRIVLASSTMLNIINDILDFSKIEAGKEELEITTFNLDEIINNVVNIVSYKFDEQGIEFKLFKDTKVPNWFFGDKNRIEQILLNVLNNAAKFTDSGYVHLSVRLIEKEKEKYHLAFCIKDTGIGMNEEQVKNLFVPFTQGDISINRRFGGSGLGLSIVKNHVDLMGGQIQVSSSLGEGTTFVINLSLNMYKEMENDIYKQTALTEEQPKEKEDIIQTKLKKKQSVLVAEDNKTNQLIIKSLLKQAGINSILAANGKEAIELYIQLKDKIDLILMDLHMPIMNGYDAAQEIRKISGSVPIAAMTADVITGVKEKCKENGIYYYISKPFEPESFIQTIKDILMENEDNSQNLIILDKELGLKNMGGDKEIYLQVIEEYYMENKYILDKLLLAVSEKRYDDAAQIVHKVKSSSGSIGAKELYNLSIKLQKALEDENEIEISLLQQKYHKVLRKLLDEVDEFINEKVSNINRL